MSQSELMVIKDLSVGFPVAGKEFLAVSELSFELRRGEALGLVGESGSGKSVSLRSILGLVPPPGRVLTGEVLLEDRNLVGLTRREWSAVRGTKIAMIYQDPLACLNPVMSVEAHLREVLVRKMGLSRRDAHVRSKELLERVHIPAASRRLHDFPHQLSGGMRQRVMIALAISCNPVVLLADEPTTALDVTVQDQILTLLTELRASTGMAVVFVSHDLDVVAQFCDRVAVMYAGQLMEIGDVDDVIDEPRHPYTAALLRSIPTLDVDSIDRQSKAIPGQPPDVRDPLPGCPFVPRCSYAREACSRADHRLDRSSRQHRTACIQRRDERAA
jgi:peptide/nickel transport system ATP-binding protein